MAPREATRLLVGYPPQGAGYGYGYGAPGPPPSYQPSPYQRPYAYPSRGQTPQQVTTDQSECGTWATQQSGYNPTAAAAASGPGPWSATLGQRVPGLFGGIERREERRAARRERWHQENVAYAGEQQDAYNRALDSCLSTRGYTVR